GVKGAELEGRFALNERLNLNFAYSYWDAKIIQGDNPGNRPYLVPKQLASTWLDYTFPRSGKIGAVTLGGGLRYLGERYSDDANTMHVPGVFLTNVMARYQINDHNALQLNVNNLFDRKYASSISSDSAAIYYGNRRTILLTLKHSW
ncbi:TonB-dependent receptor, partial [Thioclava sp. BHET1]